MGVTPRLQHIDAGVGGQGPVVVLSGAVDALERLFMEQAGKAAAAGYLFHGLHDDLVVVHCQVGLGRRWPLAHAGPEPPRYAGSWPPRPASRAPR